jgi:hypothetical protein
VSGGLSTSIALSLLAPAALTGQREVGDRFGRK